MLPVPVLGVCMHDIIRGSLVFFCLLFSVSAKTDNKNSQKPIDTFKRNHAVGILQIIQHGSLDQARLGLTKKMQELIDGLNSKLPPNDHVSVNFIYNNSSGELPTSMQMARHLVSQKPRCPCRDFHTFITTSLSCSTERTKQATNPCLVCHSGRPCASRSCSSPGFSKTKEVHRCQTTRQYDPSIELDLYPSSQDQKARCFVQPIGAKFGIVHKRIRRKNKNKKHRRGKNASHIATGFFLAQCICLTDCALQTCLLLFCLSKTTQSIRLWKQF